MHALGGVYSVGSSCSAQLNVSGIETSECQQPNQGDGQLCNVENKQITQPAAGEAVKGWKSKGENKWGGLLYLRTMHVKYPLRHRHMERIVIISPLEWKYKKPLD